MTTQPHPAPESVVAASPVVSGNDAARTAEQKVQAKAIKKERKHERLRFFFGWCEGCRAFGSGF
jgi:hypothetical protein